MTVAVKPERDEALRNAFLNAREAGDRYLMHWKVCPTRKDGRFCLKCHHLDLASNAAEDRLEALERGL